MKVPVYQKQTAPAVPAVAQGRVARPAAQDFAQNNYNRLAQWSSTLTHLPKAADTFADKFLRALVPQGAKGRTPKNPSREEETLSQAVQSAKQEALQKERLEEQTLQDNATAGGLGARAAAVASVAGGADPTHAAATPKGRLLAGPTGQCFRRTDARGRTASGGHVAGFWGAVAASGAARGLKPVGFSSGGKIRKRLV